MGRGGQKAAPASSKLSTRDLQAVQGGGKWTELPTEVLRKKAKDFGEDDSADRDTLLRVLVSQSAGRPVNQGGARRRKGGHLSRD